MPALHPGRHVSGQMTGNFESPPARAGTARPLPNMGRYGALWKREILVRQVAQSCTLSTPKAFGVDGAQLCASKAVRAHVATPTSEFSL
jgi:hypothetical protein